jgi:hypothetical protein
MAIGDVFTLWSKRIGLFAHSNTLRTNSIAVTLVDGSGVESGSSTTKYVTAVVAAAAAAYHANDFVGAVIDFTPMARAVARGGYITGATLTDYAVQSIACELWLFHTTPAGVPADNAAWTFTDATSCIGVIPFTTYYASALNSVSNGSIPNGALPFVCDAADQSIFGALVTRGTPTYGANGVIITLTVTQD